MRATNNVLLLWRWMVVAEVLWLIPSAANAFTTPRTSTSPSSSLHAHTTPSIHRNFIVLSHNVSQNLVDGLLDVNHLLVDRVDVLARCVNAALWVSNGIRTSTTVWLMLFPHNITVEVKGTYVQNLNPDERTAALYLQRTFLSSTGTGTGTGTGTDSSSDMDSHDMHRRRQKERMRLRECNRKGRPALENPFKPGALPKSERLRLRAARKLRQAAARRIRPYSKKSGDHQSDGKNTNANTKSNTAPPGFGLYYNDSLEKRLEECSALGPVFMLEEHGEPLTEAVSGVNTNTSGDEQQQSSDITFILGNQLGYAAVDEQVMSNNNQVRQCSLGPVSLLTSQCIILAHHYLDLAEQSATTD